MYCINLRLILRQTIYLTIVCIQLISSNSDPFDAVFSTITRCVYVVVEVLKTNNIRNMDNSTDIAFTLSFGIKM